jgi:putative transposase
VPGRCCPGGLVDQAEEHGVDLGGPGGLLTGLRRSVLAIALEEQFADHLGRDKHDEVPPGP